MILPSTWQLPGDLRALVADRVGRQRAVASGGHLLIVLHKAPQPGRPERQGVLFWRAPDGSWTANETGGGLPVLKKTIAAYEVAVDAEEADFERAKTAGELHEVLHAITPLHRAASHMHAVLQSARELFQADADLGSAADWAYEVSRAADLLLSDTKNAMDYEIARQSALQAEHSERVARLANRLNVILALFFPLTALASIFGMNISSGFDEGGPPLFWGLIVTGLLLGALVCAMLFLPGSPSRKAKGRHRRA